MPRPLALALSTHPGPAVAVTVVTVVLGVGVGLAPLRVLVLGVAMLLGQCSVGLSNDWIDADRDRAVGRSDKPVAAGQIGLGTVRAAALVCAVLALLLTVPLGVAALSTHAIFIASAWAYNVGLKRTPLSVLPYIVSFGLLPLLVTLSLPSPSFVGVWAMGVGGLLGVSAHFANVLPDLDDDRRTGVSGLPHRVGRVASVIIVCCALVGCAALAFVGPSGAPSVLQWIGLVVTVALALAIVVRARRPPTRLTFQLIIAAALVTVVVLASLESRLLA